MPRARGQLQWRCDLGGSGNLPRVRTSQETPSCRVARLRLRSTRKGRGRRMPSENAGGSSWGATDREDWR